MSNTFLVKMPCFTIPLEVTDGIGGQRAILLFAKVISVFTCEAVLFLENGKAVVCNLNRALIEKVAKHGPFIHLAEVTNIDRQPMPILGVNGSPIEK